MQQPIQIELPVIFDDNSVNTWLFKGKENVLVDCGMKTDVSIVALKKGLQNEGLALNDINRIIITHGHADHMGAAAVIADEADAEVWIPEYLEPWALDLSSQIQQRGDLYSKTFFSHADNGLFKWHNWVHELGHIWDPIPEERLHVFKNDAVLDINGVPWQTIYTPGHCINQVVLYQAGHKQLLSADMILKMTPVPYFDIPIDQHIDGRTPVMGQLLDSYKRLSQLDVEIIYPGHGGEMGGLQSLITRQTGRILDNIQRCKKLIENGVQVLSGIMKDLYPNRINDSTFFMVMAILDYLVDNGDVHRKLVDDQYQYFSNQYSEIPA